MADNQSRSRAKPTIPLRNFSSIKQRNVALELNMWKAGIFIGFLTFPEGGGRPDKLQTFLPSEYIPYFASLLESIAAQRIEAFKAGKPYPKLPPYQFKDVRYDRESKSVRENGVMTIKTTETNVKDVNWNDTKQECVTIGYQKGDNYQEVVLGPSLGLQMFPEHPGIKIAGDPGDSSLHELINIFRSVQNGKVVYGAVENLRGSSYGVSDDNGGGDNSGRITGSPGDEDVPF